MTEQFPLVRAALVKHDTLYYDRELYVCAKCARKVEETVNFGRGTTLRYWCGACNKQVKTEWLFCPWCGRRLT